MALLCHSLGLKGFPFSITQVFEERDHRLVLAANRVVLHDIIDVLEVGVVVVRKTVIALFRRVDVPGRRRVVRFGQVVDLDSLRVVAGILVGGVVIQSRPERETILVGVRLVDEIAFLLQVLFRLLSVMSGWQQQISSAFAFVPAGRADIFDGLIPCINNAAEVTDLIRGRRHFDHDGARFRGQG